MPSTVEVLSTIAAVGSFPAAGWVALFARRQVRVAEEQAAAARKQVDIANAATLQALRSSQIQLVIHFADSFHAIRALGVDFTNRAWCEQFWGLFYLEFFYFNQGDIPVSIFGLWMVELASLYAREPEAWNAHERYLLRFEVSFYAMYRFYREIRAIAARDPNATASRDQATLQFVSDWDTSGKVSTATVGTGV